MSETATSTVTAWAIDNAHSVLEFAVKHMMFATAKGRFTGFSGTVQFDPANVGVSSVNVEIQTASISTGDEKRDGHLKSADFFDVENHPVATFVSTSVSGQPDDLTVVGDLTLHGVTKPVTLKAEFLGQGQNPWGVPVAGFSATTKINREEFGLGWNAALEAGGVLVGAEVKLSIELELNPAEA
jgi:polyisoprenoid-binding protein YceI